MIFIPFAVLFFFYNMIFVKSQTLQGSGTYMCTQQFFKLAILCCCTMSYRSTTLMFTQIQEADALISSGMILIRKLLVITRSTAMPRGILT